VIPPTSKGAPARRQFAERPVVRSPRPPPGHHPVALGDLVLDGADRVGERRAVGGDEGLDRLDAVKVAPAQPVEDDIGRDDLVGA
jgi:hypothetical protein